MRSSVGVVLLSPGSAVPVANQPIAAHAVAALSRSGAGEVLVAGAGEELRAVRVALGERPLEAEVRFLEHRVGADDTTVLNGCEPLTAGRPTLVQAGDAVLRDPLAPLLASGPDVRVLVRGGEAGERNKLIGLTEGRLLNGLAATDADVELVGAYAFPGGLERALAGASGALPGLVERLAGEGATVETHRLADSWRYAGHNRRLIEGNRVLLEDLERSVPPEAVEGCDIQGRVSIHPSARLSSTTVRGPAVIGAGATLNGAYVGPYTSVGANVNIEGAELEHSIVLQGATIAHVGRRIETSVIGAGARVSRDFRLPSALRLTVGEGAEVSLT